MTRKRSRPSSDKKAVKKLFPRKNTKDAESDSASDATHLGSLFLYIVLPLVLSCDQVYSVLTREMLLQHNQ
uniref:Uncharacterized protein n=1 Tax=Arundo donax TaxID=35708 RepID=A0A0A9AKT5_ARUDO